MDKHFKSSFEEELRTLANALKAEVFRFIVIGHNHRSLYIDLSEWVKEKFPERKVLDLTFSGKSYRDISDSFRDFDKGIVIIPDFDWLFQAENNAVCTAFNQRRDFFTHRNIALLCFIQPGSFISLAKKLPDWWSGRSLELSFSRAYNQEELTFIPITTESSSLGGQTLQEKEAEIELLRQQLALAEPDNITLLINLNGQIANIYYQLARYDEALSFWHTALDLARSNHHRQDEGITLNNLGSIYYSLSLYNKALEYFKQSLEIAKEVNDSKMMGNSLNNLGLVYSTKGEYDEALYYFQQSLESCRKDEACQGEEITLNNIAQIYQARGEYHTALSFLEQSLKINQTTGNKQGIGSTLNNLATVLKAMGDYNKALEYLQQSLNIREDIGDKLGAGRTLNNIGSIYYKAKGEPIKALHHLEEALKIQKAIGDLYGEGITLNNLSGLAFSNGDYKQSLDYLQQSLKIRQDIGDNNGLAIALTNMAILYVELNQVELAIPWLLQAQQIFNQIGSTNTQRVENVIYLIIQQIGQARFDELAKGTKS